MFYMTSYSFLGIVLSMVWVWVVSFGVLGVTSRFAIDSWVAKYAFSFPIGTLFINIAGCFLAGYLFGLGLQKDIGANPVRLGIIVGFCGGFTTFSGFGLQFMQLLNDGKVLHAIAYGTGSPVLCILATAGGLLVSRSLS